MRKYMSKSARACDYCRARKSACRIETSPPCRLCFISGRECLFTETSSKRRGLQNNTVQDDQSGSVAPALHQQELDASNSVGELSFELNPNTTVMEHQNGDMNDMANTASGHHALSRDVDFENHSGWPGSEWLDQTIMDLDFEGFAPISTSPLNTTTTNQADLNVEQTTPTSIGHETYSVLCGLTGDMDPNLIRNYRFGLDNRFVFKRLAIQSMSQSNHPVQLLVAQKSLSNDAETWESRKVQLEEIVTQDVGVGRSLIKLFYQFVFPHVPVFSDTQRLDPEETEPCLLAAIYLVTLQFATFDDYLSVQVAYEPPDAEKLRKLAMTSFQSNSGQPDFSHLQTIILLLVAQSPDNILTPDYATKYSLVGNMVTLAGTLALQLDPSNWNISRDEIRLRKRLSWIVKMSDIWYAAALGRSCLISDDDWIVPPPSEFDFSMEEQAMAFPAQLMLMYDLTLILQNVLRSLFSLRSISTLSDDYDLTLRTAQPLVEQLNLWSNRATELQVDLNEEIDSSGPPLLGHHFVKVLIFRAILRPFLNSAGNTSDTAAQQREAEARRLSRAGAKSCVAAFTTFTSNLKSSWIHAFWPFWCTLGWSTLSNLSLILYVTAETNEDAEECRLAIDRARRTIRLQSKSFDILRFSSLRIDSIFWKGLNNVLNTTPQHIDSQNISGGLG